MKNKKVHFSVNFTFFAAAAFFLSGELCYNYLYAVSFSVLHEIGHLVSMLIFGVVPDKITLEIQGIRIDKKELRLSYRQECVVALAGPFVNLLLMLFSSADSLPFIINAGLFFVNMLPVKTLDGGRFIYNSIAQKKDETTATKILNILEVITASVLTVVLVLSIVFSIANTSFVLFSVLLVIIIVSELFFRRG